MDYIRLNAFPNVPADGKATLVTSQLLGYSIFGLKFTRGGGAFTTAMISSIKVRQNGKELLPPITGQQLLDLNEYEGAPDATNSNFVYFGDPTANTVRGRHAGDLDCSIYRHPLEIEAVIAGATTPSLEVIALAGPPKMLMGYQYEAADAARVRALVRTTLDFAGAVDRKQVEISLGSAGGALIRKIAFFHAQLTAVQMRKNSIDKHDNLTAAENSAIQTQFGRTPQAGLYVLDRVVDGNLGEAEPTLQSNGMPWNLQLALSTAAADTLEVFADLLTYPQLI